MDKQSRIKQGINETGAKIDNAEKKYLAGKCELGEQQKDQIAEAKKAYFGKQNGLHLSAMNEVEKALGTLGVRIYNSHLPYVGEVYKPLYDINDNFREENRITYFDITRWVNDKEEKNIDKLINVYQVLTNVECNIALIYERKRECCTVTLAIVNTGKDSLPAIVRDYRDRVIAAIMGNFPGAEIKEADSQEKSFGLGIPPCLKDVVLYGDDKPSDVESVAVITNLATDKSEDFISQSMEKLLDGIVPESEEQEYKLIMLASPSAETGLQKNILCEMYNALAPYASWQESFSTVDNTTIGAGSSLGKSIGLDLGLNCGFQAGVSGTGVNAGINAGINFGADFGKTANYNVTVGNNRGETKTCTNYMVKHSLDLIEEQIKRLEQCSALGMWKFTAYAVSKDANIAKDVAAMYLALTQGEESFLSQAAINFWHGTRKQEDAAVILEELKRLHHPHFVLREEAYKENQDILLFPSETSLYTLISGKELVRALNFPRKSVAGFPVIESVPFGRETQRFSISNTEENDMPDVDRDNEMLDIGGIVHMYRRERQRVRLDVNSFTSHTFVTGSTGTGKSNTIYQLLSGLNKLGKKVLVIEPAKGEYHRVFGDWCKTYGTNPKISEVLRINPFSFPTGGEVKKPIHVLEHIDRLIEILNACWPMYAAMPAVLKDAVELAYINKGWDLYSSECYPLKFPTFFDLLVTLPEVMDNSLYSKDTQSDYAGALVTRVKSLTNGINGLILCSEDELSDWELFEANVIVDISRVGSMETKAMLMGIMIMKLQEYHMSSSGVNEDLQHITVLEEAHNLLKRTSASQGQDSANLQGKSVEMLTNSIAEMRTYGEGFIIADQAPGLLDEAVIRNTNTKIILRLPDADDRELVGRAAALKDAQIEELAKLPKGVAAVYQNDWVEAVLCQFEKFVSEYKPVEYEAPLPRLNKPEESYFEKLFSIREDYELVPEKVDCILNWIDRLAYPASTKTKLRKVLSGENLTEQEMKAVAYNLFDGKRMAKYLRDSIDTSEGVAGADNRIKNMYDIQNADLIVRIRQLILQYVGDHMRTDSFENRYIDFMGRKM